MKAKPGRPLKPVSRRTAAGRLGADIRRQRLALGLTVADAARAAHARLTTWYSWERGTRTPRTAEIGRVAAVLGCSAMLDRRGVRLSALPPA